MKRSWISLAAQLAPNAMNGWWAVSRPVRLHLDIALGLASISNSDMFL